MCRNITRGGIKPPPSTLPPQPRPAALCKLHHAAAADGARPPAAESRPIGSAQRGKWAWPAHPRSFIKKKERNSPTRPPCVLSARRKQNDKTTRRHQTPCGVFFFLPFSPLCWFLKGAGAVFSFLCGQSRLEATGRSRICVILCGLSPHRCGRCPAEPRSVSRHVSPEKSALSHRICPAF